MFCIRPSHTCSRYDTPVKNNNPSRDLSLPYNYIPLRAKMINRGVDNCQKIRSVSVEKRMPGAFQRRNERRRVSRGRHKFSEENYM